MPNFRLIYESVRHAKTTPLDQWSRYSSAIYPDAETAKAMIVRLTREHTHYSYETSKDIPAYVFKMQVVPENEDFITRENTKITAGDYAKLPDRWQMRPHTYARYNSESKLIEYYVSEDAAILDKRATMKPTRYWHEYIGGSDMFECMMDAKMMVGDITLNFAKTREDIRRVYENGPNSCMSGNAGQYFSDAVHPVEAYATPDLELAYLSVGDEIIARSLCNANTKEYVRIYGDTGRMASFLKDAGYHENQYCMGGVRILKIFGKRNDEEDRRILMTPYIDGPNCEMTLENPADEYLTVISRPLVICGSTQGYYSLR